jgi:hypothetical protein
VRGAPRDDRLRWVTVGLLVAAAILSAIGNNDGMPLLRALGIACFLIAVVTFMTWRRAARSARGSVFDREAKTRDETGSGPDR